MLGVETNLIGNKPFLKYLTKPCFV